MSTIFSLITGNISASVCVIRISGPQTHQCLEELGFKKSPEHQKSYFCKIKDPKNQELIDESLISFFQSPNSFTGENVAELNLHASPFIIKRVFEILSNIENVRMAEAGEFSKRAFLNGKMDLVQAESIPDLIACETAAQHKQALKQLQGTLGEIYEDWRFRLIKISANIEAFIDFPEDDLPQNIIDEIERDVKNLKNEIHNHLDDKKIGQKIKDGLDLVIIGAPNVGKSSLINFLSKSDVAIVSASAGTTRDVVQTHLSIAGMAIKISDTAGLRKTTDEIEKEGIKRAIKKAKEADIKIFMIDANNPILRDEDKELIDENTITILNKIDLNQEMPDWVTNLNPKKISLTNKINTSSLFENIEKRILEILPSNFHGQNSALITQERYRSCLTNAVDFLNEFSLEKNIELAAEDLRMTAREVGKITGKVDIENILDVIFSSFCIGK